MGKMKVALELQPICGKRTGIGNYTYELARHLKDQDELEFYGNLFNFLGRNNNAQALSGVSIPIRTSRAFPYEVYRRIWHKIPIPYEAMFPRADLSLFFNYIVPPHIKGKVATTIHDLTYLRFPETMECKNLLRLQNDMDYSIKRSSHLLTVSEFSKREIVELLNISPERISVVPCAPAEQVPAADFSKIAEKFQIKSPYVLYIGTIEPRKNLVRLIRAFDHLKKSAGIPHQLILAGGAGWGNEEIYEAARKAEYTDDIHFIGYVSAEEKSTLYASADVFVFPSLYEGFGIPPLEAMQMSCPVVCANVASLPEVVGNAAELIDPFDEADLARGVQNVLEDKEYADLLRARGNLQYKKYTWDNSAQQLIRVCKNILEKS